MTYEIYPAVDENYQFPPVVREGIATSPELEEAFLKGDNLGASEGHVPTWDAAEGKYKPRPPQSSGGDALSWKPNTDYTTGAAVITPKGDVVYALETHNSGDIFDGAKWYSDNYGFLLGNFTYNSVDGEKLSLFYSPDGTAVTGHGPNPVYSPATGLRDPSIVKIGDVWFMAYGFHDPSQKKFAIASSTDLVNWNLVATLNVSSIPNMIQTWAPELYVNPENGQVYVFFTAVQSNLMEVWYVQPIDSTLSAWTAPSKLSWTSQPPKAMDPVFIKRDATWYMFYGDNNYICRATAPALLGPWTTDKTGDWAGWGVNKEAPEIVRIGPSKYRLYIDRYEGASPNWTYPGYGYTESSDLLTWSPLTALTIGRANAVGVDANKMQAIRHGSFIKIQDSETEKLVQSIMNSGASTMRHVEYDANTVVQYLAETQVGPLTKVDSRSVNSGDYSSPAAGQVKVGSAGVYSASFHTGVGGNNWGNEDVMEWVTIFSPTIGGTVARAVAKGGYELTATMPAMYLNAGDVLEFRLTSFAQSNKSIASRIRVTKHS